MNPNKKIVIFGATGKIGQNLLQYIAENHEPFQVVAVGRRNAFKAFDHVEYCQVDISDKESFSALPQEDVYAVVHLAGVTVTSVSEDDLYSYVNSNILGTVNVLDYAKQVGAKRIVYTHTYNDALRNLNGATEILPIRYANTDVSSAFSLYTITKNCAVDLLENTAAKYGIKAYILRLPNVYMYLESPYYMLNGKRQIRPFHKMILQAKNGEDIEIWGNPNHFMDMVYIKDCCQMILCSLIADSDGGLFNVGTGVGTSLREQVETMIDVFSPQDRKSSIIYCPEKPSGPDFVMNIENAVRELDYRPKYDFKKMLVDIKRISEERV